jgi:hypothetical protein
MNDSERDELLIRIDENVKAGNKVKEDHEVRLRDLEKTKQKQAGMIVVLTGVWAGILAYFTGGK